MYTNTITLGNNGVPYFRVMTLKNYCANISRLFNIVNEKSENSIMSTEKVTTTTIIFINLKYRVACFCQVCGSEHV